MLVVSLAVVRVAMFTGPNAFVLVHLRPTRILDQLAALHAMAPEAVLEVLDEHGEVPLMFNPGMRRVRVHYAEDMRSPEDL